MLKTLILFFILSCGVFADDVLLKMLDTSGETVEVKRSVALKAIEESLGPMLKYSAKVVIPGGVIIENPQMKIRDQWYYFVENTDYDNVTCKAFGYDRESGRVSILSGRVDARAVVNEYGRFLHLYSSERRISEIYCHNY